MAHKSLLSRKLQVNSKMRAQAIAAGFLGSVILSAGRATLWERAQVEGPRESWIRHAASGFLTRDRQLYALRLIFVCFACSHPNTSSHNRTEYSHVRSSLCRNSLNEKATSYAIREIQMHTSASELHASSARIQPRGRSLWE